MASSPAGDEISTRACRASAAVRPCDSAAVPDGASSAASRRFRKTGRPAPPACNSLSNHRFLRRPGTHCARYRPMGIGTKNSNRPDAAYALPDLHDSVSQQTRPGDARSIVARLPAYDAALALAPAIALAEFNGVSPTL